MGLRQIATIWRHRGSLALAASGLLALGACATSEPPRDPPAPSPFLAGAPEPAPPAAPAPIVSATPAPLKPATPTPPPATKPKPAAATTPAAAIPSAAAQAFRQCRDEALALDAKARSAATAAAYRAAAEQAAKCDSDLGAKAAAVPLQERMSLAAIAILDALKGGDPGAARDRLQRFKARFPGQDLALADGTSFVDTIELVLSGPEGEIRTRHAQRSVGPAARRELLRARYWARN